MTRRTSILWFLLPAVMTVAAVIVFVRPGKWMLGQVVVLCGDGFIDPGEQCEIGYPCPTNRFCTQSCRCVLWEASSSSASVICGDGFIDPGEQCEIGYPCPTDRFCTQSCQCVLGEASSSRSSSAPASSSFFSVSSSEASSTSSEPYQCIGDECDRGGTALCATLNQLCRSVAEFPCVACVDASSSPGSSISSSSGSSISSLSSLPASSSSSASSRSSCPSLNCTPASTRCWYEDPVLDVRGCLTSCGTLRCLNGSSASTNYPPRCGNGILEAGEQCETQDPCSNNDTCSRCRCTPQPAGYCGDGVLDPGEQCERSVSCQGGGTCTRLCRCSVPSSASSRSSSRSSSSPHTSSDEGTTSATAPVCGDGRVDPGEQCDANLPCPDGGFCTSSCFCVALPAPRPNDPVLPAVPPLCGNGRFDRGEQCETNLPCPDGGSCTVACTCVRPGSLSSAPLASLPPNSSLAHVPSSATVDAQSYISPPLPLAPTPPSLQTLPAAAIELPLAPPQLASQPTADTTSPQERASSLAPADRPAAPPVTAQTGPAALLLIVAGAAAGYAFVRRKK